MEISLIVSEKLKEYTINVIQEANRRMNEELKLNVYIPVDIQVGRNYAETH